MYPSYIKPVLDFSFSILLLIVISPLFLVLMLICFFAFRGQIFFKQQRIGKHERAFTIYKFTTMKPLSESFIEDKDRLTRTGKLLRKTSLDELPQLFNVIKGEMSIIGPRPLLVKYLPYYTELERKRHMVKPGITGLAQINGRNLLSWNERLKLDCQYVNTVSFTNDLKILFKTISSVFNVKNIQTDPRTFMQDLDVERGQQIHQPDKNVK